jgi:hypothetical protein
MSFDTTPQRLQPAPASGRCGRSGSGASRSSSGRAMEERRSAGVDPAQDDIALGGNAQQNNNFDFSDDQAQRRCPFVAHIRKTNPRADFDMAGFSQEKNVDPRRIIRQGIPFGPEVTPAEQTANATSDERGLMFVCYQTSIVNQFEFIQVSWVNNANFVFGKVHADGSAVEPGPDPIINQNNLAGENSIDEVVPNYPSGNVIKRSLCRNILSSRLEEPISLSLRSPRSRIFHPMEKDRKAVPRQPFWSF